jgi:hypothetical protein
MLLDISPNVPLDIVKKLIDTMDIDTRQSLANDFNTPVNVLTVLANDRRSTVVRRNVASNNNAPAHVLERLQSQGKYILKKFIIYN